MSAIAARRARLAAEQSASSLGTSQAATPSSEAGMGRTRFAEQSGFGPGREGSHTENAWPEASSGDTSFTANKRRKCKARAQTGSNVSVQNTVRSGMQNRESNSTSYDEEATVDSQIAATGMLRSGPNSTALSLSARSSFEPRYEAGRRNFSRDDSQHDPTREARTSRVHSVVCSLGRGETLCLVGVGTLRVLDGAATIGGARLTVEHREAVIIAPCTSPLPVVEGIGSVQDCSLLQRYGLDDAEGVAALIRLTANRESDVDRIHRVCPFMARDAFQTSMLSSPSWPLSGFAPVSNGAALARGTLRACMPPTWSAALQKLCRTPLVQGEAPVCLLVRGAKRVGKSTLCRYALQRFLTTHQTSVAYLELDLGQPEFGVPGMVALHLFSSAIVLANGAGSSASLTFGPNWASIRQPSRSHFIGDVSPRGNPGHYLAAVSDLCETYMRRWHSDGIPLLVNTQGWVKGMGADLLAKIEQIVQPTHILDVTEDIGVGLDTAHTSSTREHVEARLVQVLQVVAAPPILTRERGPNAVEARTMSLLSYFYSVALLDTARGPRWSFSRSLLEQRPFVVDIMTGGLAGGLQIRDSISVVPDKLKLHALNGACVALLLRFDARPDANEAPSTKRDAWLKLLHRSAPSCAVSTCVGLAIVRAIDMEVGHVKLVSPIDSEALRTAREDLLKRHGFGSTQMSLSKGALDLPVWLSLDGITLESARSGPALSGCVEPSQLAGVPFTRVPYLDFDARSEDTTVGMNKRRVRRNLLRPSQRGGYGKDGRAA